MKYVIKSESIDDIINYDKEKYNSNNHWINDEPPSDYRLVISKSNTHLWIDNFKPEYKKITVNKPAHISWLKRASKICSQTGKFSNLFIDELIDTIIDLEKEYGYLFENNINYFVRVNNVSLKYGMHGVGPYCSLKNILESIVSSIKGHCPIYDDTVELVIYLIPWVKITDDNEFRVFVYKNKITAISQQHLYKRVGMSDIENKIKIITEYFNEVIRKKIDWIENYTYDFAIIDNQEPYFIEMNCFGKEYAAGSSLFHWLLDEQILYNDVDDTIEFRYIRKKKNNC